MTVAGGCATGLLVTDPGASPVRATQDVDAVVAVVSLAEYHQLGAALRAKGFAQPLEKREQGHGGGTSIGARGGSTPGATRALCPHGPGQCAVYRF